jgi:hypothetical protein
MTHESPPFYSVGPSISYPAPDCWPATIRFGFVDNVVMLTAGELIDTTIGVRLGLATLTAAALGQVVSDVSGVFSGTHRVLVCPESGGSFFHGVFPSPSQGASLRRWPLDWDSQFPHYLRLNGVSGSQR